MAHPHPQHISTHTLWTHTTICTLTPTHTRTHQPTSLLSHPTPTSLPVAPTHTYTHTHTQQRTSISHPTPYTNQPACRTHSHTRIHIYPHPTAHQHVSPNTNQPTCHTQVQRIVPYPHPTAHQHVSPYLSHPSAEDSPSPTPNSTPACLSLPVTPKCRG